MKIGYVAFAIFLLVSAREVQAQDRPNILWITAEDMSPHLGCYGDAYARTPVLDSLARAGVRYPYAFSNASVCTPARSTLITGMYASSLGTQHLRQPLTQGKLPPHIRTFTALLREAGYYCSNNQKEDYNFETPADAWDASGKQAHWRNRKPGQPFFSVFNDAMTHQGLTRYDEDELVRRNERLPAHLRHDPAEAVLPPYYPDTRAVRVQVAAHYTQATIMDGRMGRILGQLKEDGLDDETIVFFFTDHGDGLPRGKRWLYETGTRVPLIISFPEKYRHLAPGAPNTTVPRFVSFLDFAPTMLNLLGLPLPDYLQGKPFLGRGVAPEAEPVYLFADRVGEVLDMSRGIRHGNFRYIRNYFPYKERMQPEQYSEVGAIRMTLRRLHRRDRLQGPEAWLMQQRKPAEELYNVADDPYELVNLADEPRYRDVLEDMRQHLKKKMLAIGDLSLLPEAEMKRRADGRAPYLLHRKTTAFDLPGILEVANRVGYAQSREWVGLLSDNDPAIRFWAVTGIAADSVAGRPALRKVRALLADRNPSVRIAAAEALFVHRAYEKEATAVVLRALKTENFENVLHAASALGRLDPGIGAQYLAELEAVYNQEMASGPYSARPLENVLRVFAEAR